MLPREWSCAEFMDSRDILGKSDILEIELHLLNSELFDKGKCKRNYRICSF